MTDQDKNFFEQDFGFVPEGQQETILDLPPVIQWLRGDRTNQDARLKDGCFELPVDRFQLDDHEPVDVNHRGELKPAYLFKGLHLAVVAHRTDWFVMAGNEREWLGRDERRKGAKSRMHVWARIKELDGLTFRVSFSGTNSMAFWTALKTFQKEVILEASKRSGTKFPTYAFWMPVGAGPVKEWKEFGNYSTPPELKLKVPLGSPETFGKLFVGQELVGQMAQEWEAAVEWAEQDYGRDGQAGEDDEAEANGRRVPPPPPATVGQADDGFEPQMGPSDELPF